MTNYIDKYIDLYLYISYYSIILNYNFIIINVFLFLTHKCINCLVFSLNITVRCIFFHIISFFCVYQSKLNLFEFCYHQFKIKARYSTIGKEDDVVILSKYFEQVREKM